MGIFNQIRRPRIALVAGTRPECLKLASVAKALRQHDGATSLLINSGQHLAMVERTLAQHGLADLAVVDGVLAGGLVGGDPDQVAHLQSAAANCASTFCHANWACALNLGGTSPAAAAGICR